MTHYTSTPTTAQKVKEIHTRPGDLVLIKTDCKAVIKQTAQFLSIGGVDFSTGPVKKVGTISLDAKLLQSLNAQAQILDMFQLTTCGQLNGVPLGDPKRTSLVAVHALSIYHLSQLALLAQMYSSNSDALKDALLKWIVQSGELAAKVWEKQFLSGSSEESALRQSAANATKFGLNELHISEIQVKSLGDPLLKAIQ